MKLFNKPFQNSANKDIIYVGKIKKDNK